MPAPALPRREGIASEPEVEPLRTVDASLAEDLTDLVARAARRNSRHCAGRARHPPQGGRVPGHGGGRSGRRGDRAGSRAAHARRRGRLGGGPRAAGRARRDVRAGRPARRHQGVRQGARRIHRQRRDHRRRRADRRLRRGARARALWRGVVGRGAERLGLDRAAAPVAIRCRPAPPDGLVAAASRSHFTAATAAFLDRVGVTSRISCGSSLKFCRVAEGAVDVYPRLSGISEWDIAAGHALVTAAGGVVTTPAGTPRATATRRRPTTSPASSPGATRPAASTPHSACSGEVDAVRRQEHAQTKRAGFQGMRPLTTVGHLLSACRIASLGSAMKRSRAGLVVEEIEPLADHRPQQRIARHRDAAAERDRVIAAVARHVDLGVGDEGGLVAFIAESPDRPGIARFLVGRPNSGAASVK